MPDRVERVRQADLRVVSIAQDFADVTSFGEIPERYIATGSCQVRAKGDGLSLSFSSLADEAPRIGDLISLTITRLV